MKHLKTGTYVVRANVYANHGIPEYSFDRVRVVLQHETLGTFFDSGSRYMNAWHGELHETEEEAIQHIIARLLASDWPSEHVNRLVCELTRKNSCLQPTTDVG